MTATPFTTQQRATRNARLTPDNRRAAGSGLMATMVAGMMFGMLQMIVEAVIGHGFWSPLRYIASVFTRGVNTDPSFSLGPVIVGLGGHMMNSVILGAIFAAVVWKFIRSPMVLAMAGMMWGALIYVFIWWSVIPTIDPAMKLLNAPWFFASHLVFGVVLGLGVAMAQRFVTRQRATA